MPSPRPEAARLGERFRLALRHDVRSGPAGERLGQGTGASLEFQDRRTYEPGDDVRHVDWRALARTDQLFVRQYREEILPTVELLVDGSRSMAIDEGKAQLAVDLAAVLASAARAEHSRVIVWRLEDRPLRSEASSLVERGLDFESRRPLADALRETAPLLAAGSLRVLLSDFLSPHRPEDLVRSVARAAGGLALLQVLSPSDVEPPAGAALQLTDAETEEALDLLIEEHVRERYLERLRNLVSGLVRECRRHGGVHVELRSDGTAEERCRGALLDAGVLAPA